MKVIIKLGEHISIPKGTELVNKVIAQGMISEGYHGKQYCFLTVFVVNSVEYTVSCEKLKSGTFKFKVWK